jgi:hypothetical protein
MVLLAAVLCAALVSVCAVLLFRLRPEIDFFITAAAIA